MIVVFYHVFRNSWAAPYLRSGYLAVDVFFVLSGFVMALTYGRVLTVDPSPRHYASFLLARFARIYPLYVVVTIVLVLTQRTGLPPDALHHGYTIAIVSNLALVQAWGLTGSVIYPAWSISTEVMAYLLFPLFLVLVRRWRFGCNVAVVISASLYLVMTLVPTPHAADLRHGPLDISWVGSWWPVLRCCAGFLMGVTTYQILHKAALGKRILRLPSTTFTATLMTIAFFVHGWDLLFVAATPFLIAGLATGKDATNRVLAWTPIFMLGEWSYAIYLLHCQYGLFLFGANGLLGHFFPHAIAVAATPILALSALIVAAWLTFEFFEKPARRLLRKLDRKRIAVAVAAEPAAP